jgi:YbbR domain-containing protein
MFDWLLRRWHLKLLALAIAFLVWVAVTGEGRGVQDFRVPVDFALGTGVTLAGAPPSSVTVRLRGPESLLRRTDPHDLSVRVDLRDAPSGDRTVQLSSRNVSGVPRDVEVSLIDPERLRLAIARKKAARGHRCADDHRQAPARLSGLPDGCSSGRARRRRARIQTLGLRPYWNRADPRR